jgi:3-oxoadipate enol-lactonase
MSELEFPVVDDGGPGQLPIVFLHAFPYHSASWSEQRAVLRGRARFIAFDARGLGARPHAGAYMLEHTVDDLFRVLDSLSLQDCVLCGISMGGYAALRAVQRAPERVRGLLLANTQAGGDTDAAKLGRAEGLRGLHKQGKRAFADAQLQRQLSPHTLQHKPELLQRLHGMISDSSVEGIAASLVAIATRTDLSSALGEIRVPTRVVVGADDKITPPSAAQALASGIPGAELHVLEQAGHLSNVEAPEAFNRVLLELVSSLAG